MKTISVVTPCYNEDDNVRECYDTIRRIFAEHLSGYKREHIFCDNASTDGTLGILRELAAQDTNVKVIANARNFGPMRSNYNGVLASTGDVVLIFLPADLQDPPDLLPQMVEYWEQGYELVYGIRSERDEGWMMRSVRHFYYRLISRFSIVKVPPDVGDYQLADRRIIEAMRQVDDAYPFMRIMTFEAGGKSIGIPYRWTARKRGKSKNRISHLIDQGLNGFITFTYAPMRLALYAGFVLAAFSILYAFLNLILGLLFYRKLAEPGILTLIVALFFFGGTQLFFIGLLGEYILAIYGQVRKKPLVVERERLNFEPSAEPPVILPRSGRGQG